MDNEGGIKMDYEDKRKRKIQKLIRVDESELALIKKRMASIGLKNFNTYARYMMTAGSITTIDYSELNQLRLEINRIGVNINQITKYINTSEEITAEDLRELLDSLAEIKSLVTSHIDIELERGMEAVRKD
ncbi:plasmid mobilization protein [Streptococcus suis]|uniref:plasmid mobilization protein n=2 Tax=Streptococcus suis TaxID=1307 RepID=UPI001F0CD0AB|nr:plasmid mobilization relaxosome protein MobC [Streptococcus suis]MDE3734075.1 plasmid mobilization relaxosome protein MobC [Streptococcus suis]